MAKKSLGQHWLRDPAILKYICDAAQLSAGETVLEVGPGTGTLTRELLTREVSVVAVEKDETLAAKLTRNKRLAVQTGDILAFDLTILPADYKVAANIPYYLTSNLIRTLSESNNPPALMVLLVQKEVAERICSTPGGMSLLSVSAQLYHECQLGRLVPAALFDPPPKVDSQVIILKRRPPIYEGMDTQKFFRVVKAGFSERRKKLRSALAGGLGIGKDEADALLSRAGVDADARAQELSLTQWYKIYDNFPN